MANNITISGLEDCYRWMDAAPADAVKATRKAMREASKKTAAKMRRSAPKRWRRLMKYAVDKNRDGTLSASIGMFNGHQQQGHQNAGGKGIDDWFKAYWANYGTLTLRDPDHAFKKAIRHGGTAAARKRRNNVGQPHQNFFEQASAGFQDVFVEEFGNALAREEQIFYER